ncbi:hypothetical protein EDB82DRAFT_515406 [Fusarium venenatum]|uniref:uncharacterized protein n=1 Tax=Fusarium venenatum TaxID=56646 RepID=UPI001D73323E|nr:hypothetical protein EDB82DRAFT_515406 [Fusarium venenatum]
MGRHSIDCKLCFSLSIYLPLSSIVALAQTSKMYRITLITVPWLSWVFESRLPGSDISDAFEEKVLGSKKVALPFAA